MAKKNIIVVCGIGWINQKEYGSVSERIKGNYSDKRSLHSQLRQESVFLYPVNNFGRFDQVSKVTCCAVALALGDARIPYSNGHKQDIGIIGTNVKGCLESNLNYFKDYVQAGRVLARGNLFVYTLPSSPLAEAAIHFGLQGPLFYINFPERQTASLLEYAAGIIRRKEARTMLAVKVDEKGGVCFVLTQQENNFLAKLCTIDDALAIVSKDRYISSLF